MIRTSGVRRGFSRPGVLRLDGTIGAIRSNDRTGASAAHRFHDVRMNTPGRAPLSVAALLLAVALLPIGCGTSGPPKCSTASNAAPCTRVLFVGNSYTYVNDLPTTFADLAVSGGRNVEAGMVASGGETLAQHAVARETLDKIASASWTFVVLQEQSETPTSSAGRSSMMYPAARTLAARVKAAGAQTMFFMTWAHRDGMAVAGAGTYESMQLAIDDGYISIADELRAAIAPVGFTWFVVRREHPEISMWQDDGSHPTASGTYLAACVFYAAIFRQSPEGLAYFDGLSSQDARVLQAAAASSVLQNPDQWGLR